MPPQPGLPVASPFNPIGGSSSARRSTPGQKRPAKPVRRLSFGQDCRARVERQGSPTPRNELATAIAPALTPLDLRRSRASSYRGRGVAAGPDMPTPFPLLCTELPCRRPVQTFIAPSRPASSPPSRPAPGPGPCPGAKLAAFIGPPTSPPATATAASMFWPSGPRRSSKAIHHRPGALTGSRLPRVVRSARAKRAAPSSSTKPSLKIATTSRAITAPPIPSPQKRA